MYQYRMTYNGETRNCAAYPGEQWSRAAAYAEERGAVAVLERRLVTDERILEFFDGELPKGWMRLKDGTVLCEWEVLAQINE